MINDLDRAVYCIWNAVVNHSEKLCTFVSETEVTVDEWKRRRETYRNQNKAEDFELGCAAFFLNRTNISGILDGGVIGGIEQLGEPRSMPGSPSPVCCARSAPSRRSAATSGSSTSTPRSSSPTCSPRRRTCSPTSTRLTLKRTGAVP